jgi:hypothetical protein
MSLVKVCKDFNICEIKVYAFDRHIPDNKLAWKRHFPQTHVYPHIKLQDITAQATTV